MMHAPAPSCSPRPLSRLPAYCLLLLLFLFAVPLSLCLARSLPPSSIFNGALFRSLTSLLTATPPSPTPPARPPSPPVNAPVAAREPAPCPHIAMLTAARHGSTWFVDSVDSCRYSAHVSADAQTPQRYAADVFASSELWSVHPGPLQNASPLEAADYVAANASLKILSPHAIVLSRSVRDFLIQMKRRGIPVVVMRRNLKQAFASLEEVQREGNWNVNTGRKSARETVVEGPEWEQYRDEMERYFDATKALINAVRVPVDEVWYEDIAGKERIWLEKAACYVRNCNFAR